MRTPGLGVTSILTLAFVCLIAAVACSKTALPESGVPPQATVPPGWSRQTSPVGLTLTVEPDHGAVPSGVLVEGSVSPALHTTGTVTIQFWPEGPHRSLGNVGQTKCAGQAWPSPWQLPVQADGQFAEDVKVPAVIQAGNELLSIEPGEHYFALVLDQSHATFAPFQVTALPPPSTASPPPEVYFLAPWLADGRTGWLAGARCQELPVPTPDACGNIPAPPPPVCQGLIFGTTDGGQTWQEQYRGDVQATQLQFDGSQHGLAIGLLAKECGDQPCPSALLSTTDGGLHWTQTFTTPVRLTNLAFTAGDGWLLGQDCKPQQHGSECTWYLLTTTDGRNWSQSELPVKGFALDLSHPTADDGWIAASDGGPGPAQTIVTHDGGRTWQPLPDPAGASGAWEQRIFFGSAEQGWLLAGGQPSAGQQAKELFSTSDGGKSWVHLSGSLSLPQSGTGSEDGLDWHSYVGPIVFSSDRDGWLASPPWIGLLHSPDRGEHWAATSVRDETLSAVHFADPEHGWALSLRALWATVDGGISWQSLPLPAVENP